MLSKFFRSIKPFSAHPENLTLQQTEDSILSEMNQIILRVKKIPLEIFKDTNPEEVRDLINRFSRFEPNQSSENLLVALGNLRDDINQLKKEMSKVTRFFLSITSSTFKALLLIFRNTAPALGCISIYHTVKNETNPVPGVLFMAFYCSLVVYSLNSALNTLTDIPNDLKNLSKLSEKLTALQHHPEQLASQANDSRLRFE